MWYKNSSQKKKKTAEDQRLFWLINNVLSALTFYLYCNLLIILVLYISYYNIEKNKLFLCTTRLIFRVFRQIDVFHYTGKFG